MTKDNNDEDAVVQALLDSRKEVGRDRLKSLVRAAHGAGGTVVTGSYDPLDGEWCGTGIKFQWPPKGGFGKFLEGILSAGGRVEIFPFGIINPNEVLVKVNLKGLEG